MKRVLHISGVAGVGSLLTMYRKIGSSFFVDRKNLSASMNLWYGGKPFPNMKKLMMWAVLAMQNYDIIHIHGFEILIPVFKLFGKKVVLHYHGSDINIKSRNNNVFRIICRSLADVILIGDPKMKPKVIGKKQITFLPNMTDTKSFSNVHINKNGKALCFISKNLDIDATKKFNSEIKREITYYDMNKDGMIDIRNMPEFLADYEYYIDNKVTDFGEYMDLISSTGLQALSLGLKVIHNGHEITQFPEHYKPEIIIKKLEGIYESL